MSDEVWRVHGLWPPQVRVSPRGDIGVHINSSGIGDELAVRIEAILPKLRKLEISSATGDQRVTMDRTSLNR